MVTKPSVDPNIEIRTPRDPNTLSNYHNYVTRHTSVDFAIEFERKRLVGKVMLTMESCTDESVGVTLDSRYACLLILNFGMWELQARGEEGELLYHAVQEERN